jgi:hypothetical protein
MRALCVPDDPAGTCPGVALGLTSSHSPGRPVLGCAERLPSATALLWSSHHFPGADCKQSSPEPPNFYSSHPVIRIQAKSLKTRRISFSNRHTFGHCARTIPSRWLSLIPADALQANAANRPPCRLEFAATHSKQTVGAISNRPERMYPTPYPLHSNSASDLLLDVVFLSFWANAATIFGGALHADFNSRR